MNFTLSVAKVAGKANNSKYPVKVVVSDAAGLKEATKFDHVCGVFKNNRRSLDNFISADCLVMDCDNTHTESPEGWIKPEELEAMFPDINYAIVPSRHNMLEKDGKEARPKFHVYFPVKEMTSGSDYADLKKSIYQKFSFFDESALDAARFIYGVDNEPTVWHEGTINIDEFLEMYEFADMGETISEGHRNSTMSRFAAKVLIRWGITDKAYTLFMEKAATCAPPLSDDELSQIWNSAVKFAEKIQASESYISPEKYSAAVDLEPSDYTDIGQAKVFAREYGERLKYTPATDFLCYEDVVWVESKVKAMGVLENFLDDQLDDALIKYFDAAEAARAAGVTEAQIAKANKSVLEDIETEEGREAYKAFLNAVAYRAFALKRRDVKYIQSALVAVKPMVLIDHKLLDKDELLINTPKATYFLPKGLEGAQEHNAANMITKITNVSPGTKGAEIWDAALDVFFCKDEGLKHYVKVMVGSALIGKVHAERMLIAHGDGANGKSTFWNSIAKVLGSYSGNLSADALTMGCKRNVKPELAEIRGKRLIIAAELEEGTRLNTSVVKQLCSTDDIYAEKKYKDPFSFTPSHTLVLYTNHLPRVGAMDHGIWRRLIIIPFNAKIEGTSDIKDYTSYLVENAGEAIMAWMLEGAKLAIECGFRVPLPECVRSAINKYKESNDWLGHFLEDCCYVGKGYTEKSGDLYQRYREYCGANGEYSRSTTDFYGELERAGFNRKKTRKYNIVEGLMLKNEDFLD